MKNALLSIALVLVAAGSASAMTNAGNLDSSDRAHAKRLVPGADFSNLTSEQAHQISSILHSGNENRGGQIRAILN